MIYFIMFVIVYISIGVGFALCAWLDELNEEVLAKRKVTVDIKVWLSLILCWWVIAICYKKDITPTNHNSIKG